MNDEFITVGELIDDEYAKRRAEVCIASGFLQPSEYDRLTEAEINIWIDLINKRNK